MITYRKGDLFAGVRESQGRVLIPHCCNDIGGWGSGFVIPLANNYPKAREAYLAWAREGEYSLDPNKDPNLWGADKVPFELGQAQFVNVNENVVVANMIGQHRTIERGYIPIRYAAIADALELVRDYNTTMGPFEIHAPKFGAALAGGRWTVIEALIEEILDGCNVIVYELTEQEIRERQAKALVEKPEIVEELIQRLYPPAE